MMAELIAYFSRSGQNYVNGTIKPLKIGNTEVVAKMIQRRTGAELFKLIPQVSYSDDYNECIEQAKEIRSGAPDRSWLLIPIALRSTIPFILATPIIGERCRCACLPFWSILILAERRSARSAHMRGADWETASEILKTHARAQRSRRDLPFSERKRTGRKQKSPDG